MKIQHPSAGSQRVGVCGRSQPFKQSMSDKQPPEGTSNSKAQGHVVEVEQEAAPTPAGGKSRPRPVAARSAAPPRRPRLERAAGAALASRQASAAGQTRAAARASADATAENLVELRVHAAHTAEQRYDRRLVDLIFNELTAELGDADRKPAANSDRPAQVQGSAPPKATLAPVSHAAARQEAQVKAASAVDLIEKIEAFVRSQRPGIAITLDGSLGARVEIERLGPKEVAIRLVGTNGPPSPEDIGRIRDELRARGLKVGALSVA
jgi:hypothetical protein